MTILYFLIVLGVLIFVHELGHFLVARRAGIAVEVFSLGFGPKLFGWKCGETDCRISALPLGGYVKMLGEEEERGAANDPRAFSQKSVLARAAVIAAGPLMNIVLALCLMPMVFMMGREVPVYIDQVPIVEKVRPGSSAAEKGIRAGDVVKAVEGHETTTWAEVMDTLILSGRKQVHLTIERAGTTFDREMVLSGSEADGRGFLGVEPYLFSNQEAVIGSVRPGGVAEASGLQSGDRVTHVDGREIIDWLDLAERIDQTKGKTVTLALEREGQRLNVSLAPVFDTGVGRWLIGIQKDERSLLGETKLHRYGFVESIVRGFQENGKLVVTTLGVVKRLVTLDLSYKVLGGPIVIAKTTAAAAASGLSDLFYFVAFISLQLAILNLLPIPVLDGGHLVFLLIEGVGRRPLPLKVRQIATQIGFSLLILLMLFVTLNDIDRLWGVRNWLKSIF